MKKDDLGNRMKTYESTSKTFLTKRMPVIIRIDGKAFHTYTRGLIKPFDENLANAMAETARYLCENISGCKLAFYQSDEISLLITNNDKITTESWFNNNLQKMVSVSASLATAKFNSLDWEGKPLDLALFDSRAFILPEDEVVNYFLWRQQDATRNSVSMVAQTNFPHKELQYLSSAELQEKLFSEKEINWNDIETWKKRGLCVTRKYAVKERGVRNPWFIDKEIPVFTQDRNYIERFLKPQDK